MKWFLTGLMTTLCVLSSYCQQQTIKNIEQAKKYLQKNIRYPQKAIDNERTGTVLLQFNVLHDGKVTEPVVILSEHQWLSEVAVEVVKKSSGLWADWTKDSINIIIPFYFGLDNEKVMPDPPLSLLHPLYLRNIIIMDIIPVIVKVVTSVDYVPKNRPTKPVEQKKKADQ